MTKLRHLAWFISWPIVNVFGLVAVIAGYPVYWAWRVRKWSEMKGERHGK